MSYVPLKPINQAIGSPEADNLNTVPALASDIIADKTTLVAVLLSFGVPASLSYSLVDLINKTIPLSINYVEAFTDLFADQSTLLTGDTDSNIVTIFSGISPSPEPSETLVDVTSSFTGDTDSGSVYTGGDVTDTTRSKAFVITDVINTTTLEVDSTSGLSSGDTIIQGLNSTTITSITDLTHLVVGSTSGFTASSLVASF